MSTLEIVLELVKSLAWPVTAVILLLAYRKAILALLPESKIKVSLFGMEVETTFPELETATLATLGGHLTGKQLDLLETIATQGPVSYENDGIPKEDRKWIRPLMNAGLVMTIPPGEHLGQAEGLALTPLGSLVMRPRLQ